MVAIHAQRAKTKWVKKWDRKSKDREEERKLLYLYMKLKTVVQLNNDWENYHHCPETTSLRFIWVVNFNEQMKPKSI